MHLAGPYPFRKLFSAHAQEVARDGQVQSNFIFGTLLLSLLPVIFHKKIYWFRNYTSKKSRILMGLGFVLIPSNVIGLYFQMAVNKELTMKYQLNHDLFRKMLETGDINITNPHQEWVDY